MSRDSARCGVTRMHSSFLELMYEGGEVLLERLDGRVLSWRLWFLITLVIMKGSSICVIRSSLLPLLIISLSPCQWISDLSILPWQIGQGICNGTVMTCPYSFLWTYLFFSRDYSSFPHHQPADYTCLCNRFLPSDSTDFPDSVMITCICFFAIPSHSTVFHLTLLCSRTSRVSGI